MKKLILLICVFFLSCTLFAQNYRNTGSRNRMTTTQRNYANQQRSSQARSSQKQEGLRSSTEVTSPKTNKLESDEIALVVSGEGQTKNEATASALRSAIEQAFGTFVSANTTLLNDDIVRDEVATVTSGNIKSYKELSSIQNSDGIYNVSVSAVVSIGKLISYAQSHGSSAEFAGQTFMMNIKMRELNKQNEAVALQNLIVQLKSLQDDIFDFEIQTKDPVPDDRAPEVKNENGWKVPVELTIKTNENYLTFVELLNNTLSALSMSEEDVEDYRKNRTNITRFSFTGSNSNSFTRSNNILESKLLNWYYLRNERKMIEEFASDVCDILYEAQESCMIQSIGGIEYIEYPLMSNVGIPNVNTLSSYDVYIGFSLKRGESVHLLPTNVGYVLAQSVIPFYFTMDELSALTGFKVVKESMSILENRVKRFKVLADRVGFPYKIQGAIVIIPTDRTPVHNDLVINLEQNGWDNKSGALRGIYYNKLMIDFDRRSRCLTLDGREPRLFREYKNNSGNPYRDE